MNDFIKKYSGFVFSFLSLGFICHKLWEYKGALIAYHFSLDIVYYILSGALIQVVSLLFLFFGWRSTLTYLQDRGLPDLPYLSIYSSSQISRYLPGGIFQFVHRYVLGLKGGLSHALLVQSTIMEILMVSLASVTLSVISWTAIHSQYFIILTPLFLLTVFLLVWWIAYLCFQFPVTRFIYKKDKFKACFWRLLFIYSGFLINTGMVLLAFVYLLNGLDSALFAISIFFVFVYSYFIGFVMPGAPAGLGVREVLMMNGLGLYMKPEHAIIITLLFRVTTTLSDFLFWGLGTTGLRKFAHQLGLS